MRQILNKQVIKKTLDIFSWNTVKFFLAISLIMLVVNKTDIAHIGLAIKDLSLPWLVLRIILFLILILIKALQYYALIGNVSYKSVLDVVVWQNSISNFISNSAGIASYITMLKTEQNVKVTRSGATFFIIKFGDLLAICLYLMFSAAIVWEDIQILQRLTILVIISILFGLGVFFVTIWWREKFVALVENLFVRIKIDRFSLITRSVEILRTLAKEEQTAIFVLLRKSILLSSFYMTITMIYAYTTVRLFDLPVGFWVSVYVMALLQLVSFVPIQFFGGLGISELTTVYLYGIFGVGQEVMSAVALSLRVLFYLLNALVLLYIPINAFIIQRYKSKDAHK